MATLLSEVQKKINLLAEKIGCSFEVVPEVPSQPEKIVLVANKKTKKRK